MKIDILTLFPEMFSGILESSIVKRAIDKRIVSIELHDFREYSKNKHKKVDDTVYGGGAGMLLALQPIVDCLKDVRSDAAKVILTSASGNKYNQQKAIELSKEEHLVIVCGHYEGIDARIHHFIDEEISVGDFVLTGGEIPSLAILDSVIRLLPGAIREESYIEESFWDNLLEYPQYTKPAEFDGLLVPEVLTSGNHEEIRKFRRYKALEKTYKMRPDLLEQAQLTKEDLKFLEEIKRKS